LKLNVDEAVAQLLADPMWRQQMIDAYLGEDRQAAADAFWASGEFEEVLNILGPVRGRDILDLGAGTGIASYAFCRSGARVLALEPDTSERVGRGACTALTRGLNCEVIDGVGESIPLESGSVDVVYCRQVLHHTRDLKKVMRECHRVLRHKGTLLACREHVAEDEEALQEFLLAHPVHQLAGGEHAYPLAAYQTAILDAGFENVRSLSEYESVISAFPTHRTQAEVEISLQARLTRKFGVLGRGLWGVPGVRAMLVKKLSRQLSPGALLTFHAIRP
jgi:ubiquinone/menaquinone biosynthesis C-methylase UbiE